MARFLTITARAANGLLMTELVIIGATEVATKTVPTQSTSDTLNYFRNLWNQAKDYYKPEFD